MDLRERMRLYMAALYTARKAAGLCPRCGCERTQPHYVLCFTCRRQKADWLQSRRMELNPLAELPQHAQASRGPLQPHVAPTSPAF